MVSVRRDTGGQISTRTAADLATRMVTGLLEPIYRQIDPIKIGENTRAMNITRGYGSRLNIHSRNLRSPQSLEYLVSSYPDHSFVIDRKEAEAHFIRVAEPNDAFRSLADAMGEDSVIPMNRDGLPLIRFLSKEYEDAPQSEDKDASVRPKAGNRTRTRSQGPRPNGSAAPNPAS